VDFSGEQGGGGPVSGTPAAGEDAWPRQSRRLRPGSSAASPLRDEWRDELVVGSPVSHGGSGGELADVTRFVSFFFLIFIFGCKRFSQTFFSLDVNVFSSMFSQNFLFQIFLIKVFFFFSPKIFLENFSEKVLSENNKM
jgi:hypothetical protein